MHLWNKLYIRNNVEYTAIRGITYRLADEVVFKRHECEWIVNAAVAKHFKYNPRHLPVVRPVLTDEQFYVSLSIYRIFIGYRNEIILSLINWWSTR